MGSQLRRQTVALPLGRRTARRGLWEKDPIPAPGADDIQGTRKELQHRGWPSPPLLGDPSADPVLCQGDTVCCQPTLVEME